jgi:hypothetical protein
VVVSSRGVALATGRRLLARACVVGESGCDGRDPVSPIVSPSRWSRNRTKRSVGTAGDRNHATSPAKHRDQHAQRYDNTPREGERGAIGWTTERTAIGALTVVRNHVLLRASLRCRALVIATPVHPCHRCRLRMAMMQAPFGALVDDTPAIGVEEAHCARLCMQPNHHPTRGDHRSTFVIRPRRVLSHNLVVERLSVRPHSRDESRRRRADDEHHARGGVRRPSNGGEERTRTAAAAAEPIAISAD